MLTRLLSVLALFTFSSAAFAEPTTVPQVDVNRYVGDWYEISHIPQFFEGGPCACTRQRLTPTGRAGVIGVYNSCNANDSRGSLRSISGEATSEDASNSKFSVNFGLPWSGTYWIIGLDSDYRYAVVTNREATALYILSKTPTLPEDLYKQAYAIAQKQVDLSKLEFTDQKNCTYP